MQKENHGRAKPYTGELEAARDVYKRYGIKGIFLGFNVTLLRQMIAMGVIFTTFQVMKSQMKHDREGSFVEKFKIMMAGGIAGLSSWVIGYPVDFLKTKIQSQNLD